MKTNLGVSVSSGVFFSLDLVSVSDWMDLVFLIKAGQDLANTVMTQ